MSANIIPLQVKQSRIRVVQPSDARVIPIGRGGSCEQAPIPERVPVAPATSPRDLWVGLRTTFGWNEEAIKERDERVLAELVHGMIDRHGTGWTITRLNVALMKAHEEVAKGK